MPKIIVAYDGTPHAEDALALARSLGALLGARIDLAYVYRADPSNRPPSDVVRGREQFLRREAATLLSRASGFDPGAPVARHAIAGTTTASALRELADREHAELIVFGSAHDGAAGRVHPGSAARRLLQSAHCAVAIAPDGFRKRALADALFAAVAHDDPERSARRSADALAARAKGTVSEDASEHADLLIVGSSGHASAGRVQTSASADRLIRASRVPVVVLAREHALGDADARGAQAA